MCPDAFDVIYKNDSPFSISKNLNYSYSNVLELAISKKCPRITQWFIARKFPVTYWCFYEACEIGDVNLLNQLNEINANVMNANIPRNENLCDCAISNGHLNALIWAREHNCQLTTEAFGRAAGRGQMDLLLWLYEKNCPWDESACMQAALKGHLDVLKWLRSRNAPWSSSVVNCAIQHGNLENLQWIIENGCPVDRNMLCIQAVQCGHMHILKWLTSQKFPMNGTVLIYLCNNPSMFFWAMEEGCPCGPDVIRHLVGSGKLELLKYLTRQFVPTADLLGLAEFRKHYHICRWMLERNTGFYITMPKPLSFEPCHFNSICYLYRNYNWFNIDNTNVEEWIQCIESGLDTFFYPDLCDVIKSFI